MERGGLAKIGIAALMFLFLVFLGVQIYAYRSKVAELKTDYEAVEARRAAAEEDHDRLEGEIRYYMSPMNLEKELRARFNYRFPGEKTLILVPQTSTASSSE